MKKLLIPVLISVVFACQAPPKQRYFTESAEITTAKNLMNDYVAGNFGALAAYYADTAKIFHNTVDPLGVADFVKAMKDGLDPVSSYKWEDDLYEMVIDSHEETWVEFWGNWTATLASNGKEIVIPCHVDWRFVDGKIVREYAYYDNAIFIAAMGDQEPDGDIVDDEE